MRSLFGTGLCLILALTAPAQQVTRTDPKPNVLWVILDDVGIYDMAAYGASDPARTPTIDTLARSGVVFDRCWAMPVCSPTRATLLTGTYPFRHGVGQSVGRSSKFGLPAAGAEYLPSFLPNHSSAFIGKWHVSTENATTHPLGGPAAPLNMQFEHHSGIMLNLIDERSESYTNWPKVQDGVQLGIQQSYVTTDQVDAAALWISGQSNPWFCVLSLSAAHKPFEAPPNTLATLPPNPTDRQKYLAMIEAIDIELARLLDSIGEDVLASTVVFVFGDNGTPNGVSPPELTGRGLKGTISEGGLRVPLIASGYGMPQGQRVSSLVGVIDLWATTIELGGNPHPWKSDEVHSRSLLPLIRGTGPGPTEVKGWQYAEYFRPLGALRPEDRIEWRRALTDGRWKLVENNGKRQLFDLDGDPLETSDLHGQPHLAAIQFALETALVASYGGKTRLVSTGGIAGQF